MRLNRFETGYRLVREFIDREHRYPAKKEAIDDIALGNWLYRQVKLVKKEALPMLQKEALEQLPNWQDFYGTAIHRQRNRSSVDERVTALRAYVQEHDALPRQTDPDLDVRRLGQWINSLRKAHHRGNLHPNLVEILNSVPHWNWAARQREVRQNRRYNREHMLRLVRAFMEKERRMPFNREIFEGCTIGTWCLNQRVAYKAATIKPDLAEQLRAIPGWTWEGPGKGRRPVRAEEPGVPRNTRFEHNVALLDRFVREHFRLPVSTEKVNGFRLGNWCHRARTKYAAGSMSADHISMLEQVPMWQWNVRRRTAAAVPADAPEQ